MSLSCKQFLRMQAMIGAAVHSTKDSLKWIVTQSLLANSIKNQNQKLLITLTPREFLIDGYNNTMIASMKQLGGMAGENEDPSGKFSLMMSVSVGPCMKTSASERCVIRKDPTF